MRVDHTFQLVLFSCILLLIVLLPKVRCLVFDSHRPNFGGYRPVRLHIQKRNDEHYICPTLRDQLGCKHDNSRVSTYKVRDSNNTGTIWRTSFPHASDTPWMPRRHLSFICGDIARENWGCTTSTYVTSGIGRDARKHRNSLSKDKYRCGSRQFNELASSSVRLPNRGDRTAVYLTLEEWHEFTRSKRAEHAAKIERGEIPVGTPPPSLLTEDFFREQYRLRDEREERKKMMHITKKDIRDDKWILPGEDDEAIDRKRGIDYVDKTASFPNPTILDQEEYYGDRMDKHMYEHMDPPLPPEDPSFPPPHPDNFIPMAKDPVLPLVRTAVIAAHQRKADDITALRLRYVEGYEESPFLIICHGYSHPQLQSICDHMEEKIMENHAIKVSQRCGLWDSGWLMMEFDFLVTSVMTPYTRTKYNLEKDKEGVEYVNVRYILDREERRLRKKKEACDESDQEEFDEDKIKMELNEMAMPQCMNEDLKDGIWGTPDVPRNKDQGMKRRRIRSWNLEHEFGLSKMSASNAEEAAESMLNDLHQRQEEGGVTGTKWDELKRLDDAAQKMHSDLASKRRVKNSIKAKFGQVAADEYLRKTVGCEDEEDLDLAVDGVTEEDLRRTLESDGEPEAEERVKNKLTKEELEALEKDKNNPGDSSIFLESSSDEEAGTEDLSGSDRDEEGRDLNDPFWA